jgi:tRNA (cytosine49-C5)-methyltransferase
MEQIPNTENIEFKDKFIERYSQLTDWELFKKYSLAFLRRSIRVNTLKGNVAEVKKDIEAKGWKLKQIPWCKEGFWIVGGPPHDKEDRERRDVGNLLEHHLGKIYVQEAASMIPPLVLNPKPGELVLDMCAAPGSKTTQMAAMMKNQGLLVANDVSGDRLQSLGINLQRSGTTNVIVGKGSGTRFKDAEFDKILVDAPCSGTGTIMKSLRTIRMWNPGMIKNLSGIQKRLLDAAWGILKKGGTLVYSTCTLEPEENEGVVDWLLEKYPDAKVEEVKLPGLKSSPAVLEFNDKKFNSEVKKCLRIWPQDNQTEGFFVAKIKKK